MRLVDSASRAPAQEAAAPGHARAGATWDRFDRLSESRLVAPLMLGLAVLCACLLGIHTRPVGFLATFWPANAIMLGLLLRMPAAASVWGWLAAMAAFLAADLSTGATTGEALILNSANLLGVAAGWAVYAWLPAETVRLREPASMLYLMLAAAAASAAAGLVGGLANPVLFGGSALSGWWFWFATELVNYMAILPVMLSAPPLRVFLAKPWRRDAVSGVGQVLPVVAFVCACLAALLIGGPGALAFPVPALLWCGLVYPVFPTALLTFLFGCWALVVISAGYLLDFVEGFDQKALISVRLGASLIALAPVMLASVMQGRNDLLARLHHLATHDPLTGATSRDAFCESAQNMVDEGRPLAMLMIDLDHFKAINDRHGHAAGDEALLVFARRARSCLRGRDLFGRLGGEEFAVVLHGCDEAEAAQVAERLRGAVAEAPIALAGGVSISLTASIGMAIWQGGGGGSVRQLLADADSALYMAKQKGRDRVEQSVRAGSARG